MNWMEINKSKMGGKSPKRRSSWTKHTSYPTVQNEDSIHIPAEISASTRANIRCAEKRLNASTKRLNNMQRKSLSHLDSQRKLLEKSMLAYSEKMKDIVTSRANELFREIRTRNSDRDDRVVKSPTASVKSDLSLPARLSTKRHSDYRSLKGFHQVNIHSPIVERSAENTPVPRSRSAPRKLNYHLGDQSQDKPVKQTGLKYTDNKRESVSVFVEPDNTASEKNCRTKVSPRVVTTLIPWLKNDFSDSAYSSASEELDRDCSDTASETSEKTTRSSNKKCERANQNILTVPVVHVRRQSRKNRKKRKNNHE